MFHCVACTECLFSSYARIVQCHQAFGQDPARTNKKAKEKKGGAHAHGNRHCAAVLITPNGSIRRSVLIKSRGTPASSAPAPAGTLRRLLQPRPHWLAAWGGHEGSSPPRGPAQGHTNGSVSPQSGLIMRLQELLCLYGKSLAFESLFPSLCYYHPV